MKILLYVACHFNADSPIYSFCADASSCVTDMLSDFVWIMIDFCLYNLYVCKPFVIEFQTGKTIWL